MAEDSFLRASLRALYLLCLEEERGERGTDVYFRMNEWKKWNNRIFFDFNVDSLREIKRVSKNFFS